ncbi:uncharacterized protein LOC108677628 isoform X2 [Hyalella azteca]|uniref:Uncharacterized protein LOC108677628 isoform X2 n=1 Tax=Hyalella azteca TaxID=294128 RepID=A0A8B7P5Z0_HYAAZ|nr:uncharacterized protein LOC108677628 isoform X2 [Hyalella azteca]
MFKRKKSLDNSTSLTNNKNLRNSPRKWVDHDGPTIQGPEAMLCEAGMAAQLAIPPSDRTPLLLSDLRTQFHWASLEGHYDPYKHIWCSLTQKPERAAVVIIEGISIETFKSLSIERKKVKLHLERLRNAQKTSPEHVFCDLCFNCHEKGRSFDCRPDPFNLPTHCLNSCIRALLPRCQINFQIKLEMVAPSKYKKTVLQELFLIRCPSSVSAAIKSGSMHKPATLVELEPITVQREQKSDEKSWSAPAESQEGAEPDMFRDNNVVPDYVVLMKHHGITKTAECLKKSAKWLKRRKNLCTPLPDKFDRRKLLMTWKNFEKRYLRPAVPSNDVCSDGSYSRPPVISTKDQYARVTPDSPMFGLDCEFVYVRREDGEVVNALGSICLVNEYGAEVYHTLVKPTDPIVNYCTAWSGLTEEKLSSVITTLADVQEKIRKHLPPDAILVGHSIDNDLKVMHMFHPYIIDTSIVYNLSGNHKPAKLKTLAKQFLDKEIQSSTRLGHDASEDAAASLELVQLKLQRDIKFGDASFGWCEEILPEHNFFYNMFEYLHELRGRDFGYKNGSSIITTSSLEKKVRRAMKGTPECYNFKVYDSNQEIFDAVNENKSLLPNRSVIHLQFS